MCVPLAAMAIASAVVGAAGSIYGGVAAKQSADYQAGIASQNAKLSEQQAQDANTNTELAAQRNYRQQAGLEGQQQASMAENGVDLNFGTPTRIASDDKLIGNEDMSQIYKGGYQEMRGYDINAWNYNSQAQADRAKGDGALMGGFFGAASSALSGASQVYKINHPPTFGNSAAMGGYSA